MNSIFVQEGVSKCVINKEVLYKSFIGIKKIEDFKSVLWSFYKTKRDLVIVMKRPCLYHIFLVEGVSEL